MESQPQNPEFRNNPENFYPSEVEEGSDFLRYLDIWIHQHGHFKGIFCSYAMSKCVHKFKISKILNFRNPNLQTCNMPTRY